MTKNPTLSQHAALLILTLAVDLGFGAPSNEELLSTPPTSIIGFYQDDPNYNFTPWQMRAFSGEEQRLKVVFKAEVSLNSLVQEGKDFLIAGDYFVATPGNNYRPTPTLIEFTRPDDLAGGLWTFGYESFDSTFRAGDAYHVISWTWTESKSVVNRGSGQLLGSSITLNRAIIRKVRRENPRKALSLLKRQRRLLKRQRRVLNSALNATY
ncbi:MAG: hypothetical protein WD342_07810 [Verrucomicrobiales bacterium]